MLDHQALLRSSREITEWFNTARQKNRPLICQFIHVIRLLMQAARGRARRGVPTPSTRSGSWSGSSSLAFTSTRRSGCSSHGCSTWQTARWKSGFRTGGWKRRSWTETVYSTSPQTPCYKTQRRRGETEQRLQRLDISGTQPPDNTTPVTRLVHEMLFLFFFQIYWVYGHPP